MSKIAEKEIINEMSPEEIQQQQYRRLFANVAKRTIVDITKNVRAARVSFTNFTKDQIMTFLRTPSSNVKNLRNASIAMYQNSPQYRRQIQYNAKMTVWAYTIAPLALDPAKKDVDGIMKSYYKVSKQLEIMNLKHELSKATTIALVEGVIYGVIWETNMSFFVQKLNPDMCQLSSIEDGTWMYAVDMSRIAEEELNLYPPEFTTMWKEAQRTKQNWQEVPKKISFCLKGDETTLYPNPPFAGVLPEIYDLYTYKELAEVATNIDNYKLICMETPSNSQGEPTVGLPLMKEYYDHIAANLPEYVGLAMSPTKLEAISFDKSKTANSTSEISDATQRFWYASGTSPLLFGDASNTTAQALSFSIKADEENMIAFVYQCERLVNRILKEMSGSQKWKINFLPVTIYSVDKYIGYLKEAASFGVPVKTAYGALVNLPQTDFASMAFLENEVLKLPEIMIPMKSSYTQGGDDGGRPRKNDEDLSDEGSRSRDKE